MSKSLGIFIATPGRASLWKTLYSIYYQKAHVEDVLVVGDGYHKPTAELVEFAAHALTLPVRYVATTKTRDYGHTQQNYALQHVRGDYLIYQDDDDIFLPRALTEAARLVNEFDKPKPLIGRVKSPRHGLLWQRPGPVNAILDGHCIVVPNDKRKLGWFNSDYNGDQCYIHTCLRNYKEHAWTDRIWTLTRPTWKLRPSWSTEGATTWACDLWREGMIAATVLLEKDETFDLYHATINAIADMTPAEAQETIEFAMYAAQGNDVWLKTNNELLMLAARVCNFKDHITTKDYTEMTHAWPPDFWPTVPEFNQLIDPSNGTPLPDWRDDIWGGKAVDDE